MRKRIIAVLLMLSMTCTMLSGCKKVEATTMRLLRYQGRVVLQENGKNKKIKENIRLNSGNDLETSIFSTATVGLDDVKMVSMDQQSRAEFNQSGKKLEMNLTKGSIFFEVQEKLKDDETFEIKTSTMVVGIRGTSGYVEIDDDGNERVIVTDGVVHVTYTDPVTGEISEADVSAGEEVRVFADADDYYEYISKFIVEEGDDADNDDNNAESDVDETDVDDGNSDDSGDGEELSVYYEDSDGYHFVGNNVRKDTFPSFARNYILAEEDLKEKIEGDMGEEKLDEILWDDEIGYEPSSNSYGSYTDVQDLITALEQLEMVFRIAAYTLNKDAEGLETYLESKNVPGAEYITDWGMKMLDAIK